MAEVTELHTLGLYLSAEELYQRYLTMPMVNESKDPQDRQHYLRLRGTSPSPGPTAELPTTSCEPR